MDIQTRFLLDIVLNENPKELELCLKNIETIFNTQNRLINQLRNEIAGLERLKEERVGGN